MDENKLQQEEEELINSEFQSLLSAYLSSKHRRKIEIITKAFTFAKQAHRGVRRRSGEPYILHPITVAKIVCSEIGLGSTSICAALLHDVVEDTEYTVEDIENLFGPKIAQIVDGLTKISGGIFGDQASAQAENFKKLLLTMNDDIRVILIKIADRLHNMRTLGSMLPNKQYKIAGETLYIYAPLANRLGLNRIKNELEDLSFKYERPNEYAQIEEKLKMTQSERDNLFNEFTHPIKEQLDKQGINYRILARVKTPYSIWSKMQAKQISFDDIFDILAVRIIFTPNDNDDEVQDCYDIYVNLLKLYTPHPDRLRDWVTHPKSNGYQSLHVTLMSNRGQWVEVQIRSERMNAIAEQGFAAHWKYKEGEGHEDESELEKWLRTIKDILDDPQPDAIDFLDTIKMNLFASEILVFTPKGEFKSMPQGSTVLDFAFSIHTFLGSHCIGAKVNHKLVPISYKLRSGDQVEILKSNTQHVQPTWINFVTTAKAKSKIQAILRREDRLNQQKGEEIVIQFLKDINVPYLPENVKKLCLLHDMSNPEALFSAIGKELFPLNENDKNAFRTKSRNAWKRIATFGLVKKSDNNSKTVVDDSGTNATRKINNKQTFKITPESIEKDCIIASCCKPIPGDEVLGVIDSNNHIVIHKRHCSVADKLKTSFGNRLVAADWETGKSLFFPVNIHITGIDEMGVLNKITGIISQQLNVNIHKLYIDTEDGIFEGRIQILVRDVTDVKTLIDNLRHLENIQNVSRVDLFEKPFSN
ncbi:MAG: RelA/SpoT family protein [Bacteroidales bacterium]|nr:RelA/SpoT family protein [Bacteroidales bacterium]